MFERFTDRARQTVTIAFEEARRAEADEVGPAHLLFGIIAEGENVGAQVLAALGVPPRGRAAPAKPGSAHRLLSEQVKKVFDLALREALQLGVSYIAPEHLLLGLVRHGSACALLTELGVDPVDVRREVIAAICGHTGQTTVGDPPRERFTVPVPSIVRGSDGDSGSAQLVVMAALTDPGCDVLCSAQRDRLLAMFGEVLTVLLAAGVPYEARLVHGGDPQIVLGTKSRILFRSSRRDGRGTTGILSRMVWLDDTDDRAAAEAVEMVMRGTCPVTVEV